MTESFYDLLGVPSNADDDEIERAYRRRIKETHPDVNDDPDASERTARIVEARDVLINDAERARYDRVGHEVYVDGSDIGHSPGGTANTKAAADAARSGSSSGPTNARASAEERRRREREAREDVDFGSESVGTDDHEDRTTGASGSATTTGSQSTSNGSGRSTANTEPPSWSDTSNGWAARTPANTSPGLLTHTILAVQQAPATALVTFLLYPLLVLGAFFPAFPLAVNVIVGACLLTMIAAAQSVAGMGVAVYGIWSAVGTVGLVAAGASPFSPLGLVVLGTTWLPLGFSVLTYHVLDA